MFTHSRSFHFLAEPHFGVCIPVLSGRMVQETILLRHHTEITCPRCASACGKLMCACTQDGEWVPPALQRPGWCDSLEPHNAEFLQFDNHPCTFLGWPDASPEPAKTAAATGSHADKGRQHAQRGIGRFNWLWGCRNAQSDTQHGC